ncbi:MAG: hypothetical protein WAW06_03125 [bacterium]
MNARTSVVLAVVSVLVVLSGCGEKQEAVTIAAWDQYQDPYSGVTFRYPQGWPLVPEGGRFSMFSSQDVVTRFYDFTQKGRDGARLVVASEKMEPLVTLDQYQSQMRTDLGNSGFDITSSEAATLAGVPASLVHYRGAVDNDNVIEAIQVSAVRDSMLFTVKYEAFNEVFGQCKPALDTVLASLTLPRPKATGTPEELSAPSAEMAKFENQRLSISYPANFETSFPAPKAPTEFSMDIKGYRQDSYVRIDIIPAGGLDAAKVLEQNAKFYKETSRSTVTVAGIGATYLNYSPMKDIQSRVYFVVKNDKIYRIIMNYYAPMRSAYLPAFESTVGSLVIK